MNSRRLVVLTATSLLVAVPLLSACASSGGETTAGADSTVKVGLARTLTYMPAYVAQGLGYFDEEGKKVGIKIEVVPFDSSSKSLPALASGNINMDVQLAQNAPRAQIKGQDLVITATMNSAGVGALVVAPGIDSPKALEGKTIAFTGKATAAYPLLLAALKKDGVDSAKVKFLTISDQSTFEQALKSDQVQGILPGEPVISQTVADGVGKVMYDFFDRKYVNEIMDGPYVSVVLMANADWAKKNPKGVKAVTNAIVRAMEYMKQNAENPDKVLSTLPANYQKLKPIFPDLLKRVNSALPDSPETDAAALENVVAIDIQQGNIDSSAKVDITKLIDNQYVSAKP